MQRFPVSTGQNISAAVRCPAFHVKKHLPDVREQLKSRTAQVCFGRVLLFDRQVFAVRLKGAKTALIIQAN